jgi:hypothetical protein
MTHILSGRCTSEPQSLQLYFRKPGRLGAFGDEQCHLEGGVSAT